MTEERERVEFFEGHCCVCFKPIRQKEKGRLRRTCSAACRQKLYRMRHPTRGRETQEEMDRDHVESTTTGAERCVMCGAELVQGKRGTRRKTCSDRCRARLWRAMNPRCEICGKRFKPEKFHQTTQRFCSRACREKSLRVRRQEAALRKLRQRHASFRPEWLPGAWTAYRVEEVPWDEDAEQGAVVRERAVDRDDPWEEREIRF